MDTEEEQLEKWEEKQRGVYDSTEEENVSSKGVTHKL